MLNLKSSGHPTEWKWHDSTFFASAVSGNVTLMNKRHHRLVTPVPLQEGGGQQSRLHSKSAQQVKGLMNFLG